MDEKKDVRLEIRMSELDEAKLRFLSKLYHKNMSETLLYLLRMDYDHLPDLEFRE